eukprot:gene23751-25747_t
MPGASRATCGWPAQLRQRRESAWLSSVSGLRAAGPTVPAPQFCAGVVGTVAGHPFDTIK